MAVDKGQSTDQASYQAAVEADRDSEIERLRDQVKVVGGALAHMALGVAPAGEPQPVGRSVESILAQTIGDEPELHDDVHQLLEAGAQGLIDARKQEAANV